MSGIEHLFLSGVVARLKSLDEVRGEVFPEELAVVRTAVAKRRREFLAGRVLCRQALADLGMRVGAIAAEPDRRPAWPEGVVGSISHSTCWCAVAVARKDRIAGVGLDIEEGSALPDNTSHLILTPRETASLGPFAPADRDRLALLAFSAKESVYKCLSAQPRGWLDFTAVEIAFDIEHGTFGATLVEGIEDERRASIARMTGRFSFQPGFVITATTLTAQVGYVAPEGTTG